jgi:hypothetical protein
MFKTGAIASAPCFAIVFSLLLSNTLSAISLEIATTTNTQCPLMKVRGDFIVRAQYRSSTSCIPELIVAANGEYIYRSYNGKLISGTLSHLEMTRLKRRVAKTNFALIKAQPFTGTCPIAYDGVETIYTFPLGKIVEEISSCQYILDGKNPLFQQINRLAIEFQRSTS